MMIAVDAAGGDYAPHEVVKGAVAAVEEYQLDVALVGRKALLQMLARHHGMKSGLTIVQASQVIECNESPLQAVRSKPDSSIVVGTKLVRDGTASAFVSAGNTGAVLCSAFLNLPRLKGVQRPALCSVVSVDADSPFLLIDVGANVDCRPEFLLEFAQLGTLFARGVLDIDSPRVGLLADWDVSNGGSPLIAESYRLLSNSALNFIDNIGGKDILRGKADVIVTDGFTGNIVLKTMEGLAGILQNFLEADRVFKIGDSLRDTALVHYSQLISIAERMDYKEYGGACLLGIRGNIIVAHGRSQARAIKNAIYLAHKAVRAGVTEMIGDGI
ncbi:MAG TPA: phosphate acyltransferase PlsX [Dehalococcoidia bacterium]|nr:phosphate acyltransferase PlsX [Dehalococcoidia bacterium]